MFPTRAILLAALASFVPGAFGQSAPEPVRYNQVELSADTSREVANDTLSASLFVDLNDSSPASLANRLNTALNDALKTAAAEKAVRARSGGYNTYPVHDRSQKLTGWRGRAEIRLESRDFAAAGALIARLQSTMQLGGVSFSVSPERRREVESELIREAVAAFRARAEVAVAALGGKAYRIRRVALDAGGPSPGPRPQGMRMAAASAESVPPPAFEPGVTQIALTASGTIEVE